MSKKYRLGIPERFTAKPATISGRMSGAGADLVDPGQLAKEELGDLHWGELMGYMVRRFGQPNLGGDTYQDIARWMITTPMKGTLLTVTIAPHGTWLLFGYLIPSALDEEIHRAKSEARLAERDAFESWCLETHGEKPRFWRMLMGEMEATDEEKKDAQKEIEAWLAEFSGAYERSSADPRVAEIEAALRRTLRDLRRTVSVRDQWLSATGTVKQPFRHIEYDRNGLAAMPAYAHGEDMRAVWAAVHRLGGGAKGLARLARLLEREVPAGN